MIDLIIYHAQCTDGWCAAYVAQKAYPGAELLACGYGDPLPQVTGRSVLVVDFSWPREQTYGLRKEARSFLIFDHHKTAQKELEDCEFAIFNMNKSGAGLTWDNLFSSITRSWYVNYTEDADLWRFALPNSRAINAYLHSLPFTIEAWDALEKDDHAQQHAIEAGNAILQYRQAIIDREFQNVQFGVWDKNIVGVVNASAEQSNLGEKIYNELPVDVAMMWHEDMNRLVHFGLRSKTVDVGEFAARFPGGGGHKNASGFELPYDDARVLIDQIVRKN